MTRPKLPILLCIIPFLSACGYKGDLYLPKENDKARFGVIQTGIDWRKPKPQNSPQTPAEGKTGSQTTPSSEP